MRVCSICIVGGGSSGWMTAALLSKKFKDIKLTLIEPKDNNPLGVGESTLGQFNTYLRFLGLEDKDWMSYCNATYKTSISFKNFRDGKGERFQYPFGKAGGFDNQISLNTFFTLQKLYPEFYPPEEFARFINFNTFLTESKKIIPNKIKDIGYNPIFDTAYHFDAGLFGNFLKEKIALPNNINYIQGEVVDCIKKENGELKEIITSDGNKLKADLFIDCTGFKSLLLEKCMDVDFISYNKTLPNDTALATRVPYRDKKEQMETYTDCVAMDNGWVWNIPLWNRVGTGYVFSSKYCSPKQAEEEFRKYLEKRFTSSIAKNAKMKLINIKHGKHKVAWEKNVVGIGLSYGFLEPLESTGLLTTHENIIHLFTTLQKRNKLITKIDIDTFNTSVNNDIEELKEFIEMHYYMSSRQDTPYWVDITNNKHININSNSIYNKIVSGGGIDIGNLGEIKGGHYVMAGMNYNPLSKERIEHDLEYQFSSSNHFNVIHKKYQKYKQEIEGYLNQFPLHYDYLKENIFNLDT